MRNLLNPKWIIFINTIPIIILALFLYRDYAVIRSLLEEDNLYYWKVFSITLSLLAFTSLGHATYLLFRKKQLGITYGILSLLLYISMLYTWISYENSIVPFSIPVWMTSSGTVILYASTFLMPTILHALLVIVLTTTAVTNRAWKSFGLAVAIPIAWYLFFLALTPLWRPLSYRFAQHMSAMFLIIGTVLFLFFLVRALYIVVIGKSAFLNKNPLVWKIPISIILPILGLLVNGGGLGLIPAGGIFGDFSHPLFFILAIVNGIFICLPNAKNSSFRLFLYIGRSVLFAYTFYFFLVFLPFLPLSLVAVINFGTGFLMLTPLLLFVIHIQELTQDFTYAKKQYKSVFATLTLVVSMLVIPLLITRSYYQDRNVLNKTLDYIYNSNYSEKPNINKNSLQRTLNEIKFSQSRNSMFLVEEHTPFLSHFYKWIVLDNLTLSKGKTNRINSIFFDKKPYLSHSSEIQGDSVLISDINSTSTYDPEQKVWTSWVDLELTNKSDRNFSEFATSLKLPTGCWISDYYLYIEGRKEFGLLAEKKSAMWVYSQIKNRRKDPGILYYQNGQNVAFRIYPFNHNEVRKTGIQLIHKEPTVFAVENQTVQLGKPMSTITTGVETKNALYISTNQKASLPKVKRTPYFHLLLDISNETDLNVLQQNTEKILSKYPQYQAFAKISFVNSQVTTYDLKGWKEKLKVQKTTGGYYLDRAIKETLVNTYQSNNNYYPIIVAVTNSFTTAILDPDYSDFKIAFPENDLFYVNEDSNLVAHSLAKDSYFPIQKTIKFPLEREVLAFSSQGKTYYLRDDSQPSIIPKNNLVNIDESFIKEREWTSGLEMESLWTNQVFHPKQGKKHWLKLVKYSFISRIMTPLTSYISLENEAQKAALLRKQKQILSGNKSLGDQDTRSMSEPGFFVLLGLLGVFLYYRNTSSKH